MGFRNPFRIRSTTSDVAYVTDYSPDSQTPQVFRGPAGHRPGGGRAQAGELRLAAVLLARPAVLPVELQHPHAAGLARPQPHECDNPNRGPRNDSRWNLDGGPTVEPGLEYGPPITKPDIWYSYQDNNAANPARHAVLRLVRADGSGPADLPAALPGAAHRWRRPARRGAVRLRRRPTRAPTKFPPYYDGSFILGEFTRDYLREVRLDSQGNVFKINHTLNCGAGAIAPTSRSSATTRWTCSSGRTAASTCSPTATASSPSTRTPRWYRFELRQGPARPDGGADGHPDQRPGAADRQLLQRGLERPRPGATPSASPGTSTATARSTRSTPTRRSPTRPPASYTARLTVTDSSGKTGVGQHDDHGRQHRTDGDAHDPGRRRHLRLR